jgi:hypothetical protein
VNQLVLSGTATPVLSGTQSSCYRGLESTLRACFSELSSRCNFTNQKSFGFPLTEQTPSRIAANWQRRAANPACAKKPHRCFAVAKAYVALFQSWGPAA